MKNGRILQYGYPRDVYENPSSDWVASFVGETNILGYEGKGSCFQSIVEVADNKNPTRELLFVQKTLLFKIEETNNNVALSIASST